jgi:hypothetical protein
VERPKIACHRDLHLLYMDMPGTMAMPGDIRATPVMKFLL